MLHPDVSLHARSAADSAILNGISTDVRGISFGTRIALASSSTTTVSSGGERMATLGERIAAVEGDVREQRVRTAGMKEEIANLRLDMNARFDAIDRRFESVDRRLDLLDAKMSRQFVWLVGVQVMTLAAVVTSLATILSAVAGR